MPAQLFQASMSKLQQTNPNTLLQAHYQWHVQEDVLQ